MSGLVRREGPGLLVLPLTSSETELDDARGKRVPEDVPVQILQARELDKALGSQHLTRKTLKSKGRHYQTYRPGFLFIFHKKVKMTMKKQGQTYVLGPGISNTPPLTLLAHFKVIWWERGKKLRRSLLFVYYPSISYFFSFILFFLSYKSKIDLRLGGGRGEPSVLTLKLLAKYISEHIFFNKISQDKTSWTYSK